MGIYSDYYQNGRGKFDRTWQFQTLYYWVYPSQICAGFFMP